MAKLIRISHLINTLFGDKTKIKGDEIKDSFIMQSPSSIEITINTTGEITHYKTN